MSQFEMLPRVVARVGRLASSLRNPELDSCERAFLFAEAAGRCLDLGSSKTAPESVDTVENAGLTILLPVDNGGLGVVGLETLCYARDASQSAFGTFTTRIPTDYPLFSAVRRFRRIGGPVNEWCGLLVRQ